MLQHTATRCNTLQYTTTHYNTLQHTGLEAKRMKSDDLVQEMNVGFQGTHIRSFVPNLHAHISIYIYLYIFIIHICVRVYIYMYIYYHAYILSRNECWL